VVLDESGSVINQTDYEPFGATVAVTGIGTRKQYIDKEKDRETGTANHGVRQYDPEGPGFASVDPLWEKYPAWTPYHYSFNNPLGTKDPSGLDTTVGDAILDGLGDAVDGIIHVLTAVTRYEVLDGKSQYSLIDGLKSTWNTATGENGTYAQVRLLVGLGAETTFWATATGGLGAIGGVGKGATQVGRAARMTGKSARAIAKTGTKLADDVVEWTWSQSKGIEKSIRQMNQRGWTRAQVTEAIKSGQQFPATNLVNKGNSAIRYVHPETGQSVVQDVVTKEIIHFGGPGFKY